MPAVLIEQLDLWSTSEGITLGILQLFLFHNSAAEVEPHQWSLTRLRSWNLGGAAPPRWSSVLQWESADELTRPSGERRRGGKPTVVSAPTDVQPCQPTPKPERVCVSVPLWGPSVLKRDILLQLFLFRGGSLFYRTIGIHWLPPLGALGKWHFCQADNDKLFSVLLSITCHRPSTLALGALKAPQWSNVALIWKETTMRRRQRRIRTLELLVVSGCTAYGWQAAASAPPGRWEPGLMSGFVP